MNKSTANTQPDKQAERKAPSTPLSTGSSAFKPGICLAALLAAENGKGKREEWQQVGTAGTGRSAPKGESWEGTLSGGAMTGQGGTAFNGQRGDFG